MLGHFSSVPPLFSCTNFSDLFCFAAHAEVNGPDGEETAWAGGDNDGGGLIGRSSTYPGYTVRDFGGRSWATYIEALLSTCVY